MGAQPWHDFDSRRMSQGSLGGGSAADRAKAVIGPDITPIREGDTKRRHQKSTRRRATLRFGPAGRPAVAARPS